MQRIKTNKMTADFNLQDMAAMIGDRLLIATKPVLSFDEALSYLNVSKSWLYKATMNRTLPYTKPNGKLIYFKRADLDEWLSQNRVATSQEIDAKAQEVASRLNRKGGCK